MQTVSFNHYLTVSDFRQITGVILPPLLLTFLLTLGGCAATQENQEDHKTWSAERLYKAAKQQMEYSDYELAIEYFETLESRYPFGKLAEQAQLETAYAYYKFQEQDAAIAAAERFIKLHPSHPKVDYAYYLRGLAAFHKKDSLLDNIAPQDPSERDPSSARDSFNYFAELVKKFPKSKYAPDSVKRMKFQRNTLAKHELNVASYYLKRGAFVAAANRAKYIVENYPQTPAIPSALALLTKAYTNLNMHDLANDAQQVLKMNYPDFNDNMINDALTKN
ncbi:MAG: outer membrane protein assembly factor BamD [Gammaproteobacteria bacterium]|nr:outer membrane protein assembly factor BamD [Gammaproteobacteria bacterium]